MPSDALKNRGETSETSEADEPDALVETRQTDCSADEARRSIEAALNLAANTGVITLFTEDTLVEQHWRKLLGKPNNAHPIGHTLAVELAHDDAGYYEPHPDEDTREPLPSGVTGIILIARSIFQRATFANALPVALAADAITLLIRYHLQAANHAFGGAVVTQHGQRLRSELRPAPPTLATLNTSSPMGAAATMALSMR